jgi:hypothetical protein
LHFIQCLAAFPEKKLIFSCNSFGCWSRKKQQTLEIQQKKTAISSDCLLGVGHEMGTPEGAKTMAFKGIFRASEGFLILRLSKDQGIKRGETIKFQTTLYLANLTFSLRLKTSIIRSRTINNQFYFFQNFLF